MSNKVNKWVLGGILLFLVVLAIIAGKFLGRLLGPVPSQKTKKGIVGNVVPQMRAQPKPSNYKKIPGMVFIPGGEFIMGTNRELERPLKDSFGFKYPPYSDEEPRHKATVKGFYLDKFEVTIGEYRDFCQKTGRKLPEYLKEYDLKYYKFHPITRINYYDAQSYAAFIKKRLPTESEWEKAARGTGGLRYVWGDKFDAQKSNIWQKGPLAIGWVPTDKSVYGIYDLMGNVAEWTSSFYNPYPGNSSPGDYKGEKRVIKGGSWGGKGHYYLAYNVRASYRGFAEPDEIFEEVGFRCALSLEDVDRLTEKSVKSY